MKNGALKGGRVSHASPDSQWRAYERLPASVRKALQDAAFDWASYPIWRRFESGRVTAKELVKAVRQWDADRIKRDRKVSP